MCHPPAHGPILPLPHVGLRMENRMGSISILMGSIVLSYDFPRELQPPMERPMECVVHPMSSHGIFHGTSLGKNHDSH